MNTSYKHIAPDNDINTRVTNFYSVCVDKFFKNPNKIRKWGLSLDKNTDPDGEWPGKRTTSLHNYDIQLHNELILKVFSTYLDLRYNNVSWSTAETMFQEIETYDNDTHNRGWIHKDNEADLAFIIYLTPNADKNSGTSLFDITTNSFETLGAIAKKQFEKEQLFKGEKINEKEYKERLLKHESYFTEKTRFSNIYNRMIAYDSDEYHRANNFVTNTEKRLTLIGFIKGVEINEMPLQRVRSAERWDNNLEKRINNINQGEK
jgi:hypothetical protein